MTRLTLATVLQLTMLAPLAEGAETESYADAYRKTAETGQPLVVLVGAEWCPACVDMKRTVVPRLRQQGLLQRVAFALVDIDRDRELGQKLIAGGAIPQLIVCRKAPDGWHRQRLIGGQSVKTVEELLHREIVACQADRKPEEQAKTPNPTHPSPEKG